MLVSLICFSDFHLATITFFRFSTKSYWGKQAMKETCVLKQEPVFSQKYLFVTRNMSCHVSVSEMCSRQGMARYGAVPTWPRFAILPWPRPATTDVVDDMHEKKCIQFL